MMMSKGIPIFEINTIEHLNLLAWSERERKTRLVHMFKLGSHAGRHDILIAWIFVFGREEKHWPLSLGAKHFSLYIAVMIRISTFLKGAESYGLSRVVKNISFYWRQTDSRTWDVFLRMDGVEFSFENGFWKRLITHDTHKVSIWSGQLARDF